LYAFDLTTDLGEDDHFSLVRQGSVHLALKFSRALGAMVNVIAYAELQSVIEIDRNRNVVFDFCSMNMKESERVLKHARFKTLTAYSAPIHCLPSHTYWSSTPMIRINPVVIGCACG